MNKDQFVNASGLSAAFKTFLREAKKIFIARSSLGTGFSWDASGKLNVTATGETGEMLETDPTVPAHVKAITEAQIAAWNNPSISSETDPTVPAWAKEPKKPVYTASEVGAAAAAHDHEISDVTGLQTALDGKQPTGNYLVTETDPTVPAWAKAAAKPNYTASEVGAAPAEHSHEVTDVTGLQAALDGKAAASHKHDSSSIDSLEASKITGTLAADNIPALDASKITSGTLSPDVLPQGTTTAVTWDSISGKPSKFAPEDHTHTKSEISDFPVALKNPNALTVQFNGTTNKTYDGSAAHTVNITPAGIGAAEAAHDHEIEDVAGLQTALDGKQPKGTYLTSESDPTVPAWAKAEQKPAYTASEVGAAEAAHTHTKSEITDFPTAIKNPSSLTIKANGVTYKTYNGGTAVTADISPALIGAAEEGHVHAAADIDGLSSALNNKAAKTHTHAISDVSGLQETLDYIAVPEVTAADDGKFMRVVNGVWAAVAITNADEVSY